MSSATKPAISAFRTLLRAVTDTFRGDSAALLKCRLEARKQFRANIGERDSARIIRMIADAEDAAMFIRESVVQAKLNEQGHYAMKLKPQGSGGGGNQGENAKIEVQTAGAAAEKGVAAVAKGESDCGTGCGCG